MHESDGPLPSATTPTRRPDQPDGSGGGCLRGRLRGHAPADLGVGEHAAADREPARAPPLADVGPLVEHPRDGRRRGRLLVRLLRRRGGREARAGLPLPGEAAERVQVPGPHRRPLPEPRGRSISSSSGLGSLPLTRHPFGARITLFPRLTRPADSGVAGTEARRRLVLTPRASLYARPTACEQFERTNRCCEARGDSDGAFSIPFPSKPRRRGGPRLSVAAARPVASPCGLRFCR